MVIDRDPAARAEGEIAGPPASSSRGRIPAEKTTRSVSRALPSSNSMRCGCSPPAPILVCLPDMHLNSQRFDLAAQDGAAAGVDLHRHEARRKLDHVGLESQTLQGVGRLQTEQPAPDHDPDAARLRLGGDGLQILDGAIDEAAFAIAARDGRHERIRAGREHQLVVSDLAAAEPPGSRRACGLPCRYR